MSKKFSWELFNTTFIKSIVYSEKTKKKIRPGYPIDDKDGLVPRMNMLCHQPDEHFVRRYEEDLCQFFQQLPDN